MAQWQSSGLSTKRTRVRILCCSVKTLDKFVLEWILRYIKSLPFLLFFFPLPILSKRLKSHMIYAIRCTMDSSFPAYIPSTPQAHFTNDSASQHCLHSLEMFLLFISSGQDNGLYRQRIIVGRQLCLVSSRETEPDYGLMVTRRRHTERRQ